LGRYRFLDAAAVARLGKINLVARGVVEGFITGLHRSPYHGFSVEFAEHRKYTHGDDLRHVDWTAYARTDRYYVKMFEEETNVRCYILLDKSASMGYGSGGLTKLEYACYLAGCLSYLMIKQQDSVGLVSFDTKVDHFIPPRQAASHLSVILEELERVRSGARTDMARTFHDLAEHLKRRSLVVILSDLLDEERELLRALHHFRQKKHEVILFHVMDHAEVTFPYARLSDFVDLETGERMLIDPKYVRDEYLRQYEDFRSRIRRDCSESFVEYVPADTSVPFEVMLSAYLARRSR